MMLELKKTTKQNSEKRQRGKRNQENHTEERICRIFNEKENVHYSRRQCDPLQ